MNDKVSNDTEANDLTLDTIRDVSIYQRREGYRFSLDAVLLYSFVHMKVVKSIADLGAGSGVVGLMLARKFPSATVTLVEMQKSLHGLALRNVELNGLSGRMSVLLHDLREPLSLRGLDLVVSNPPFRKPLTGRLSHGRERAVARHELELSLPALMRAASSVLRARGRFCLVYHPHRLSELLTELANAGLEPKRLRFVHGNEETEAKMLLLESVRGGRPGLKVEKPLFVYEPDCRTYTEEVRNIFGQ